METMKKNDVYESEMFLSDESNYSFDETVLMLSDRILAAGWKISAIHDLQATLMKNGKDVLPVKIFELCNPLYSGELLEEDALRVYSPMVPCRISVYEVKGGKVFISRMNSAAMASGIGGKVEEVMSKAFREMEAVVRLLKQ